MGDCSDEQVLWNLAADCVERILYDSKMVVGPFFSVEMITDAIDSMGYAKVLFGPDATPKNYEQLVENVGELLTDEGFYVIDDDAHSELWELVTEWASEKGIK